MFRAVIAPALCIAAILVAASAVYAQCEPRWLPGLGRGGPNNTVRAAIAWDPDGPGPQTEWTVIAGDFSVFGNRPVGGIIAWDGETWHDLAGGVSNLVSERVHALTVWNGQLIVGGEFDAAGGVPAVNVARFDAAADAWLPFGAGLPGYRVTALVVHNGELFAGGQFQLEGTSSVARWDGTGWTSVATGSGVDVMASYNGELYAGGSFSSINGSPIGNLARLGADGTWQNVGGTIDDDILALAVFDNRLVVGGRTQWSLGGPLALWDGEEWSSFPEINGSQISNLAVLGEDLYAQGGFVTTNGVTQLARWSPADGGAWHALGSSGFPYHGTIYCLASVAGRIILGGDSVRSIDGVRVVNVGAWDGQTWAPLTPGLHVSTESSRIDVLAEHDGELYIGGYIWTVGTGGADAVVRWNGDSIDRFPPPMDGGLLSASSSGGSLVVGGNFFEAGGVLARNIARFDGQSWHAMGTEFNHHGVRDFVEYQGQLIAAGNYSSPFQTTAPYLARWAGSEWELLADGLGGSVNAIAADGDNLYVGGDFLWFGGISVSRIAKFDGTQWSPIGSGISGRVHAMTVYNGDLIVGGYLSGYVRRWDGETWTELSPPLDGEVYALTTHNGELYAGGRFTSAGGTTPLSHIARWTGDGWAPLGAGIDDPTNVRSVRALASFGSEVVAAGGFPSAGGQTSIGFARYTTTGVPTIAIQPRPTTVPLGGAAALTVAVAVGYDGLAYQWRHNGTALADGPTPHGSLISGATTPALAIDHFAAADAGAYSCLVSNPCGETISLPATLTLTGACPADWNPDGTVNDHDISAFLTAWLDGIQHGTLAADFNADGAITSTDISAFLSAWLDAVANGC